MIICTNNQTENKEYLSWTAARSKLAGKICIFTSYSPMYIYIYIYITAYIIACYQGWIKVKSQLKTELKINAVCYYGLNHVELESVNVD